jgi:hypothetical protein
MKLVPVAAIGVFAHGLSQLLFYAGTTC